MSTAIDLDTPDALQPFSLLQIIFLAVLILASIAWINFLSHRLAWPMEPKFAPSMFASLHPIRGLVVVIVGGATCLLVGAILLGRIKPDAGLMLAACGLARLAAIAGPVGTVIRSDQTPHPYAQLFLEMAVLSLLAILAAFAQRMLRPLHLVRRWPRTTDSLARHIIAGGMQAVLTGVMVTILAQNDAVKQTLPSVFLASMLGAVVIQGAMPITRSTPLWIGALVSGLIQYAWAALFFPANPLSPHRLNVSPLAYASLGIAGTITAFWGSLRWNIIIEPPNSDPAVSL